LKLKSAERKSKTDSATTTKASAEGALETQTKIDKMTKEIAKLRKDIKKNIQQKNEFFSTKVTTQKQSDLFTKSIKTIETQIKNIKEFIAEVETTITGVEAKIKEEKATKKVIESQKAAFKAAQKKTAAEEELNSERIITEKKKAVATAAAKECKKKFDEETNIVKKAADQLKTLKKTAGDSKGSKEEKARLETESE